MKLDFLKDIISEIGGKPAAELAEILYGKESVNEFLIAKKMKLTINQVRNILYKLSNFNLVTFTRKKEKKKGWYTYFWTLDIEKTLEFLKDKINKKIQDLQNQLKNRKEKSFYNCQNCNIEVNEETALLNNFTCQECGEVYHLSESDKEIRRIKTAITKLENERNQVLEELEKEREKQLKKAAKKQEKEKAKKKKTRKKTSKKKTTKKKTKKPKTKKKKSVKKAKKKKTTKKKTKKPKTKKKKSMKKAKKKKK